MKYHSDADLDRALFALPLEEAPPNLRASILAVTAYRPAPPFKLWEAWTFGGLTAIIVWLCISIASGEAERFVAGVESLSGALYQFLSQPATIIWLAIGVGVALWVSLADLAPVPSLPRVRR